MEFMAAGYASCVSQESVSVFGPGYCTPSPACGAGRSADAGAHEALHELPLEQQERDQQGRRCHQRRREMIDQSMPWSLEEKTCSPTVSGRAPPSW